MKYLQISSVLLVLLITSCSKSSGNRNSAFSNNPQIQPRIDFIYPDTEKLAPNGAIIIELNKPVDKLSVENSGLKITEENPNAIDTDLGDIDNNIVLDYRYENDDTVIIAFPKQIDNQIDYMLKAETVYYIILDGIKDNEGIELVKGVYQFTTKEYPDTNPPKPVIINKSFQQIAIAFKDETDDNYSNDIYKRNDYINPETVFMGNFSIEIPNIPDENNTVDFSFAYDIKQNVIVLIPANGAFQVDTEYKITINGVKDLAGNELINREISFIIPSPQLQLVSEYDCGKEIPDGDCIATLPNGNFVVVNHNRASAIAHFDIYNETGILLTAQPVNFFNNVIEYVSIAVLTNNSFVISFRDYSNESWFVIYNHNLEPVTINPIVYNTDYNHSTNSITCLENDNFVISYFSESEKKGKFCVYNKYGEPVAGPITFVDDQDEIDYISSTTLNNGNIIISYYDFNTSTNTYISKFLIYDSQTFNKISEEIISFDGENIEPLNEHSTFALPNNNFVIAYSGKRDLYTGDDFAKFVIYNEQGKLVTPEPIIFLDKNFDSQSHSIENINSIVMKDTGDFLIGYEFIGQYSAGFKMYDINGYLKLEEQKLQSPSGAFSTSLLQNGNICMLFNTIENSINEYLIQIYSIND